MGLEVKEVYFVKCDLCSAESRPSAKPFAATEAARGEGFRALFNSSWLCRDCRQHGAEKMLPEHQAAE